MLLLNALLLNNIANLELLIKNLCLFFKFRFQIKYRFVKKKYE